MSPVAPRRGRLAPRIRPLSGQIEGARASLPESDRLTVTLGERAE